METVQPQRMNHVPTIVRSPPGQHASNHEATTYSERPINDSPPFPDLIHEGSVQQALALLPYIPNILLKLGSRGVLCIRLCPKNSEFHDKDGTTLQSQGVDADVVVRYYPGLKHEGIVSVTGAGYYLIR